MGFSSILCYGEIIMSNGSWCRSVGILLAGWLVVGCFGIRDTDTGPQAVTGDGERQMEVAVGPREGREEERPTLEELRTTVARRPADPEARQALARGLGSRGLYGEAAEQWRQALALDPENRSIRGRLAASLYLEGEVTEAAAVVDRAVREGEAVPAVLPVLLESGEPPRARIRTLEGEGLARRLGAPVRVDSGGAAQAAETSIVAAGNEMLAAWNDQRDGLQSGVWRLGVATSFDGGATWSDSLLRPPNPEPTRYEGDPMTAYDPRTGSFWAGAVEFFAGGRVYIARKPPGTTVFESPVVVASDSSFDKGWMAAGPAPGNPNSTHLYVAYSFPMAMRVSSDLGATWSAERLLHPDGISFHPRVGPNGELYLLFVELSAIERVRLQRSLDGGATVGAATSVVQRVDSWDFQDGSRFPGRFRVAQIVYLAVSPVDGTLYCVYFDTTSTAGGNANVDLYLVRSDDGGASWTSPVVINGDTDPPGDQFFPWLEVDASGRLHLAYFDSRYTVQDDDVEDGRFDITYATSGDRGASWTEMRVTDSSFGSGMSDWNGTGQFMGDYIGLVPTGDGGALVVYPASVGADLDIFAQRISAGPEIFTDGFESGDTSAWSVVAPRTPSALGGRGGRGVSVF